MSFRGSMTVAAIASVSSALSLVSSRVVASDDAYAPLKVYAGHWSVVSAKGKTTIVQNTCARTGLFYVCEQALDGVPKNLVIFLPQGGGDDGATYRTQTLSADGAEPGHWFRLAIKAADWVYAPEGVDPRQRTLNHVIDADHIRYEMQTRMKDGWKTTSSGIETRIK